MPVGDRDGEGVGQVGCTGTVGSGSVPGRGIRGVGECSGSRVHSQGAAGGCGDGGDRCGVAVGVGDRQCSGDGAVDIGFTHAGYSCGCGVRRSDRDSHALGVAPAVTVRDHDGEGILVGRP